jgi:hypothetical protein
MHRTGNDTIVDVSVVQNWYPLVRTHITDTNNPALNAKKGKIELYIHFNSPASTLYNVCSTAQAHPFPTM